MNEMNCFQIVLYFLLVPVLGISVIWLSVHLKYMDFHVQKVAAVLHLFVLIIVVLFPPGRGDLDVLNESFRHLIKVSILSLLVFSQTRY